MYMLLVKDILIIITPFPIKSMYALLFDNIGFGVVLLLTLNYLS